MKISYHSKQAVIVLGSCAAVMTSTVCQAQSSSAQVETQVRQTVADATGVVADEGPASRTGYGPTKPSIELAADESGSKATFSIAAGGVRATPVDDKPGFYKVTRQNFSFKAIVPISKGGGETPFSFGDLGNFEKVEFGFTQFTSRIGTGKKTNPDDPSNQDLEDTATRNCVSQTAKEAQRSAPTAASSAKWQDFVTLLSSAMPDESRQAVLQGDLPEGQDDPIDEGFDEIRAIAKAACTPEDGITFVAKYVGAASARAFVATLLDPTPIVFWGLAGTAGQAKYEYIDAAAFSKLSQKKTAIAASAHVGLIGADYSWSMRAKYSYLREYEASKNGQICRPSTVNPGTQDCLEGALGGPVRKKSSIASFELRRRFDILAGEGTIPIAIAPQVTYDFDKKDYGVDVPIYLTANKEGKLTGGLRFGYRSDTKDVGAGLFIGVPFQIPF